ncbi:MAG: NCS2 family permease [Tissierellia bacterium]|nr:NCS2 family permease [Tissierellia bacterium]
MEKFFGLKESGTSFGTELIAGVTTFFAMSYIIFVNPAILAQTGIPWGAVFLATILAAVAATLFMGLYANVPYALAPGMGLNAFFTYTVVFALGFTWQEALAMVFVCGIINILITISSFRKQIIISIPKYLHNGISGGIGIFIAYTGLKNGGLLEFTFDPGTYDILESGTVIGSSAGVPALVNFTSAGSILTLIGLAITVVLLIKNVKGAIIIGILATTVIGIPMGVVDLSSLGGGSSVGQAFEELGSVMGVALGKEGLISLFSDPDRYLLVFMTVFAFSLSDTFDTIGTFIGTGRQSGIFTQEDEDLMMESGRGFKSKMDRALFADSIGTSVGAILGTSNTTTFVESAAGIGAGGRTGLASVVVAVLFLLSIFLAPLAGLVPAQATAPALIIVGVMMISSFKDIDWLDLEVAIPTFFSSIFMGLTYSISYGIAAGFIFHCLIKLALGKKDELHPILIVSTVLFIVNFVLMAII